MVNTTPAGIELAGWTLADATGRRQALTGMLAAGATVQITLTTAVPLGNRGDSVILSDPQGSVVDRVAYTANQVRDGHTICFGR